MKIRPRCEIHLGPRPCEYCRVVHDYGDAYLGEMLARMYGRRGVRSPEHARSTKSHAEKDRRHREYLRRKRA